MIASWLILQGFIIITNAQFVERPPSGKVFVPINKPATFLCSVEEEYGADWRVVVPPRKCGQPAASRPSFLIDLYKFSFEGLETTRSTLTIKYATRRRETTNETIISCFVRRDFRVWSTVPLQVIFYNVPPPPIVRAVENKLGALNISWSLEFIEEVSVNYTIKATKLNSTGVEPVIISGLVVQYYVFEDTCNLYSITLEAVTAAGISKPSEPYIFKGNRSNEVCSTTTISQTLTTASLTAKQVSTPSLPVKTAPMSALSEKTAPTSTTTEIPTLTAKSVPTSTVTTSSGLNTAVIAGLGVGGAISAGLVVVLIIITTQAILHKVKYKTRNKSDEADIVMNRVNVKELTEVAVAIEAAVNNVVDLKHVEPEKVLTLVVARSIATATSALIKSVSAILTNKNAPEENGVLSSKAQLVLRATGDFCNVIKMVADSEAPEEELIAAAKAMMAATTQLLVSCQSKRCSESMATINQASKSVETTTPAENSPNNNNIYIDLA